MHPGSLVSNAWQTSATVLPGANMASASRSLRINGTAAPALTKHATGFLFIFATPKDTSVAENQGVWCL